MTRMKPRALVRAALRDEWDGLERITREVRAADLITLANCLTGITAMLAVAAGFQSAAVLAVLVGILLDGADGVVARLGRTWGGGPLGPPLDSLADAVTFVAAPAVIAAAVHGGLGAPWWLLATLALYAVAGLLRLARFETLRDPASEPAPRRTRYFSGLPSPAGALLVTVPVLVGVSAGGVAVLAAGAGVLMASRFRYPKLRGLLGATAGTLIALALVAAFTPIPLVSVAWALLAFMAAFLVGGPFYVLSRYGPVQVPP